MAKQVQVGEWFTTGSMVSDMFGGALKQCTKVSSSRVYYLRYRADSDEPILPEAQYCEMRSVQFICKTKAELEAIRQLGFEQYQAISAATALVRADFMIRLEALRASYRSSAES